MMLSHFSVLPLMLVLPAFFVATTNAQQTEPPSVTSGYISGSNVIMTMTFAPAYPVIDSVAERFSEEYGEQRDYVNFEKRPEGYFIAMMDAENYRKVNKREIFWSSADGQWKKLSLEKGEPRLGSASKLVVDKYYFDRVPYYGYPGWYRDVIGKLEGQTGLSDVLQFSLATAWYQRATSLLSDQYGIADSLETFILPNRKNAMTPEQLKVYLQYMNRSLEHYETLVRQAPDFETIVGPATVKLADQYMTAFMQLHYFQNEETALKILDRPPLTYNDFLLESSRNLLRCCPKNAILLTYGDNDTYPLLYVQAKQGFRRDVVVANLSLLGTGRYVNHLRGRIFDAAPLQYQISPEYYFSDSSAILYLNQDKSAVKLADLLACATSGGIAKTLDYPTCDASGVYFFVDKKGRVLPAAEKAPRGGHRVEITLKPKFYLIRDQLAVLDLLYSNTPDRPICFATTCRSDVMEPFKKHLRLQGLVYRFDPKPEEVIRPDWHGGIDVKRSYQLFVKEMEYNSRGPISFDGDPYIGVQRVYLIFLARLLNEQGKSKAAAKVLDRYLQAFPNERVVFARMALYMAEAYEKAGKLDKALAVGRQVLDNFEAGKIDWEEYDTWAIGLIRRVAEKSKDEALLKRLEGY